MVLVYLEAFPTIQRALSHLASIRDIWPGWHHNPGMRQDGRSLANAYSWACRMLDPPTDPAKAKAKAPAASQEGPADVAAGAAAASSSTGEEASAEPASAASQADAEPAVKGAASKSSGVRQGESETSAASQGPQIWSEDGLTCFACNVQVHYVEQMQAHCMSSQHVRNTQWFVEQHKAAKAAKAKAAQEVPGPPVATPPPPPPPPRAAKTKAPPSEHVTVQTKAMPRMAEPVGPSQDRPVGPPSAVSPDSASAAPSAVPAAPSPVNQEAPAVPPAVSQGSAPAAPPAVSQGSAAPRAAGAPPAASTEQPPPPKQAAVKKEEPASSAASELQSSLKREAPGDAPSSADSQGARRTSPRTPQAKEQLRARRQALLDELTAVDEELGVEEFASSQGLTLSSLTDEGHSLVHVAAEQLRLNQVTPAFFSQVVRAVPADMVDLLTVSGRPAGATALHMLAGSGRDQEIPSDTGPSGRAGEPREAGRSRFHGFFARGRGAIHKDVTNPCGRACRRPCTAQRDTADCYGHGERRGWTSETWGLSLKP